MNRVLIYTDGACSGNPGPGGCAALLISGKHAKSVADSYPTEVTNNQMELSAILLGLRQLKAPSEVLVITDSELAVGWLAKGNKRKDLTLRLILEAIEAEVKTHGHVVAYHWVKGHASDRNNAVVDDLARRACLEAKRLILTGESYGI